MKRILFLLTIIFALFTSCEKKDTPNKGKLDPNATILLRPAKGVKLRAENTENAQHLSALEIVQKTNEMTFYTHWDMYTYLEKASYARRGFSDPQRDFDIPALKMWGTDIISQDGRYVPDFIEGFDFILITQEKDTIGYIPNAVINAARDKVKSAYDAENYSEVYRIFNEAFTFLPITGKEWRELKEQDKN